MSTTRFSQTLRSSSGRVRTALFALSLGLATACGGAPKPAATTPSGSSEPSDNTPITDAPTPPKATGNPLKGVKLWVDPESLAQARANALRAAEPAKAALL